LYAAACTALGGIGGQAEVFCNLLIAAAFYLVIRNLDSLKSGELSREIHCVMFLLGTAITIKQTSIFPSLFLGLLVSALLLRSGWSKLATSRAAMQFVMAGVLPSALIAGAYWIAGYWAEFFHAMVTSNLTKGREAETETFARAMLMLARLAPLITLALLSVLLQRFRAERLQMHVLRLLGWLVSVVIGLFVVPNFFLHYALPLSVPLAILAAPVLDRKGVGLIIALPSISILALSNFPFDLGRVHRSNASIAILASAMRDHAPRGTALVFDGPVYLYALSGLRPLSPLVFPNHLSQETERNVSPYDTNREVRRILENGPGAVVISANPSTANPNVEAWRLVTSYVARHCQPIESRTVSSWGVSDSEIRVFGDCEPANKLRMN